MKNIWIWSAIVLIGSAASCRQIAGVDDFQFDERQDSAGGGGGDAGTSGGTGGSGQASSSSSSGVVNTGWSRRRALTLHSPATTALSDFQLMIKLKKNQIDYTQAQPAGQDLRFISEDGKTILAHEIEQWNVSEKSFVWVRIPMISPGVSGPIYMLYGNPQAGDGQSPAAVWGTAYRAVWHLQDDTLSDSTGKNANCKNVGTTMAADGRIGPGRYLSGADNEYIDTGHKDDLAEFTVEAWAEPASGPDSGLPEGNSVIGRHYNYTIGWDSNVAGMGALAELRNNYGTWKRALFGILPAATHPWYYFAVTYDGQTLRAYKNGQQSDAIDSSVPAPTAETAKIGKWAQASNTHCFKGRVDEVRIADVARSADWIEAQYVSMADNGFVEVGVEEAGDFYLP